MDDAHPRLEGSSESVYDRVWRRTLRELTSEPFTQKFGHPERLWRSIKYEEIYLKAYDSVRAARNGITQYLQFYNAQRPHQAHGQATPDEAYFAALPFAKMQAA